MATGLGFAALLLLPFEIFDVFAVGLAACFLWWMWSMPARTIRHDTGPFPWSPVVFGCIATIAGGAMLGEVDRPGFAMATVLLAVAVAVGGVRAATAPVHWDDR